MTPERHLHVYLFKRPEEFGASYVLNTESGDGAVDLFALSKDLGFMIQAMGEATGTRYFSGMIDIHYHAPEGLSAQTPVISDEIKSQFEAGLLKRGLKTARRVTYLK